MSAIISRKRIDEIQQQLKKNGHLPTLKNLAGIMTFAEMQTLKSCKKFYGLNTFAVALEMLKERR